MERNPKEKLTTLHHHINEESLKAAYCVIKRDAAPGVDGVTWEEYGAGVSERQPVTQAYPRNNIYERNLNNLQLD